MGIKIVGIVSQNLNLVLCWYISNSVKMDNWLELATDQSNKDGVLIK